MRGSENPWRTLASRAIYDNPWISVTEHQVVKPSGGEGIYGVVHFKNRAIGVLPVDEEGFTWLVGQYRYALEQYSWEIPEGGGRLDEEPLHAAQRELKEETGMEAEEWREILRMHLSNSVTDELAIVYLARGLRQGNAHPEDTEQLQVRRVPLEEAYRMVCAGEITDAISVAAILRVKLMMLQGEL
ncbi:MAG: NUDIX hydrolase [Armatimonadetes bacterium]|nr:NUDIX hydrolase [Armatimonadota bacterium]